MSTLAALDKLDGENYSTWSIQMKSLLVTLDLWSTIEEACPQDEAGKKQWKSVDRKALATITLAVKTSELLHIKNCLTAGGAWTTLSKLYKTSTAGRKVNLFKQLVRFRFNNVDKMSAQLHSFGSVVDALKEIGVTMNDDLLAVMMLSCLPDEMDNFVVAIECQDTLPKMEVLINKILEEELRQTSKTVENGGENILAAGDRRKQTFQNQRKGKKMPFGDKSSGGRGECNLICFKCKKRGHIKANCMSNQMDSTQRASSLTDGCKSGLATTWFLDSGATSHMCRYREMFATLEPKKQSIVLASGESIYSEGIGKVRLVTKENQMFELENVWYVPQLCMNFISVSKLLISGMSVVFTRKSAIIKKDDTIITMAKMQDNMFIMKADVNTEAVNEIKVTSKRKRKRDRPNILRNCSDGRPRKKFITST